MKWSPNRRTILIAAAGAVVFVAAFLATVRGHVPWLGIIAADFARSPAPERYQPQYAQTNGNQLVMIYFGSAHCAWANDEDTPRLVEQAKLALERQAARHGWSFEAIGVGLDWTPEEGLGHLRKFGKFDEVSAGYNWANSLAIRFFNDEHPEPPSTPEILVVRRTLTKPSQLDGPFSFVVTDEQLVTRKSGLVELRRWVQAGSLLPPLPGEARGVP